MHPPTSSPSPTLRRRSFLVGAAATGLLAACASDDTGSDPASDESSDSSSDADAPDQPDQPDRDVAPEFAGDSADLDAGTFNVIQRFPPNVLTLGEVRLPFTLSSAEAAFVSDGPLVLGAQILDVDGNEVGPRLAAERRDVAPAPYYSFRTQIDTPGVYGIAIDGGPESPANFQVFESSAVAVPQPGQPMPPFDTPTEADPAGVDPICTREPVCDFHATTLTDALAAPKPVVYFVGTPAFCRTGSCAPALESMIEVSADYADAATFVHAEVWTDLTASDIAPAVLDISLDFEPALFITDADGVIVDRIDGLWDITELRERLDAALA